MKLVLWNFKLRIRGLVSLSRERRHLLARQILTSFVVLTPLLSPYGIKGINLGFMLFIVIIPIIFLVSGSAKVSLPKYYTSYFLYLVTIPVIVNFYVVGGLDIPIGGILLMLALGISYKYFDLKYGIKVYYKIAHVTILFFILQEVMFLLLGYRISGLIPFLPLIYKGRIGLEMDTFRLIQMYGERSPSVFLEPAHFALYILPYLVFELFKKNKSQLITKKSIFITILFFILGSGIGIMGSVFCWFYFLLYHRKLFFNYLLFIRKKYIIIGFTTFIILAFGGGYYFTNSEKGKNVTERVVDILTFGKKVDQWGNEITYTESSAFVRTYRGYIIYDKLLTPTEKLFGVSYSYVFNERLPLRKDLRFYASKQDFINSIQAILINHGAIGLFLFLLWIKYLIRSNTTAGKLLIVLLLILMLTESVNSTLLLMFTTFAYHFKKQNLLAQIDI